MPYKNIEDRRAQVKRWREENPERQKEIEYKARKVNAEKIKEQHEKFNELHPEKQKDYMATYDEKHPGKLLEFGRKDWEKHNSKRNAHKKIYRKENPQIGRAGTARHRARKLKTLCTFTTKEWLLMVDAYNNCCAYCNKKSDSLAQEHVI